MANLAMDHYSFGGRKRNVLKEMLFQSSNQQTKKAVDILRTVPQQVHQNVLWYLRSLDNEEPNIAEEDVHCYLQLSAVIPGLGRLRKRCEMLLLRTLSVENAIYMLHVGEGHKLAQLEKESKSVISQHLPSMVLRPDFSTLEKHQIQGIIGLHIATFGDEGLCKQISRILGQDKVSEAETVKKIKEESDVGQKSNPGVRRFGLSFMTNEKHRLQVTVRELSTNKLYTTKCTNELGKAIKVSPNFAACVVQSTESDPPHLFITGGAGESNRQALECDLVRGKWKCRKPMAWGREGHALCTLNNTVYVIGGFRRKGGDKRLVRDIEKYDCEKKSWSSLAALVTPVYSCACVEVGSKIFIIGGKNELGFEVNEIQVLDTEHNKISVFCGLPKNCAIGKAVLKDNTIFFATTTGNFLQINPNSMYIQILCAQPQTSKNFTFFSTEDFLLITYHGDTGKEVSTYKYMPDKWTLLDKYKDRLPYRVYGQCTALYPSYVMQVPFCD